MTAGTPTDPGARIRAIATHLSPAERRVARLMEEDPGRVAQLTASALAGEAATSAATVVRTAKRLGFEGYPQLRVALATQAGRADGSGASAERDEVPQVADIEPGDEVPTILAKLVAFEHAQLVSTARVLSAAAVEETAGRLAGAGRCCVFGLGASGLVAQDLAQKVTRIGLAAFVHTEQEAAVVAASLLGPGDVALAVSHAGETPGAVEPLRRARHAGAFTAAITSNPWSSLAGFADRVLTTANAELGRRSAAVGSRTGQLLVVDTLFARVASLAPGTATALQQTHDAVADSRSRGR
ncbi:MurR/RpiR family transcriptional regulator [uncultured Friedmanniella sp.]|uniref:MurR/RpiR family transcriptional regulator n=1 Tax=uncultured Friedmanniella sp. TaxID=335381 RepID=UPI0035CAFCDF